MTDSALYDRQRRLAEVGELGQARIQHATANVAAQAAGALVEVAYLVRAGVGSVTVTSTATPRFEHAEWFRFEGARSVGEGAWRALGVLRRALVEDAP